MAEEGVTSAMFSTTPVGGEDIELGSFNESIGYIERHASLIESPFQKNEDEGDFNDNIIEIEKWADSLQLILDDVPQYMCKAGHPGRISKIPESLREIDIKSYEPYFLSIGPYHHGKVNLQRMEKRKQVSLKCFLQHKPDLKIKDCLDEIRSIEEEARRFYSDVEMESEQFVQMLLFDGFYIVTSFCGVAEGERMNPITTGLGSSLDNDDTNMSSNQINEDMWTTHDNESTPMIAITNEQTYETNRGESDSVRPKWFWTLFMHDIFLLENQLPLFVLQKVYTLAYGGSETQFLAILRDRVAAMLFMYTKLDSAMVFSLSEEVHHLLHLCHQLFRPTLQQETLTSQLPESSQMFRLGSVVQLYEAGVSFKVRSGSSQYSLLDVTFGSSGTMIMPSLCVDDNTNSLLRNLIALEQMKYPNMGLNVSAYAVLLLQLITTPEDVKLLRRRGIIQHHLASDKEMMQLINRLSVGLTFDYVGDSYSLKPVFQELNRYTGQKAPRGRAWLKHKYFSNLWTVVSLFAASFLLILSAMKTYYSVYSYYHPFFNGQS